MIKSVKIRLKPTKEQEELMRKSVGVARFTYNWGLNKWEEMYKQGKKPSKAKIKKEFNNTIKKQEEYKWLYEVSGQITAQAFGDLSSAYDNFFKGKAEKPKFKRKRKSRHSFYVRYDEVNFNNGKVNMEKIGKVAYRTNYNIPELSKYKNPRCHFDGKYWYLTLGFEQENIKSELSESVSIGIDLGIKNLAICSNLEKPIKNINKTSRVKKIKKKIKRLQRQVSRKYEMNKQGTKFIKTQNIIKLESKIKLAYRKLSNIRLNHTHQTTNKIVKTKPSRVVMERLNVIGMMKNKHLSKAIQEQNFYEFKRQIEYKCEFNNIQFVEADKWYPSSKMCSCCGSIKKNLKLSDRTYVCEKCGVVIDRDYNASINLANY